MRLLLDENVTRKLAPLLKGHEVLTVQKNGLGRVDQRATAFRNACE